MIMACGLCPGRVEAQFAPFPVESLSRTAHWGRGLSLNTCTVQMEADPDPGSPKASPWLSFSVFAPIPHPRNTARFAGFAADLEWDPSPPLAGMAQSSIFIVFYAYRYGCFACMYISVHHSSFWCLWRPEEVIRFPVVESCVLTCGFWELNLGALEEHPVL